MEAAPSLPKADDVGSSSSSSEVSVKFDKDDRSEVYSTAVDCGGNGAAAPPLSNGGSDSSGEFLRKFLKDK